MLGGSCLGAIGLLTEALCSGLQSTYTENCLANALGKIVGSCVAGWPPCPCAPAQSRLWLFSFPLVFVFSLVQQLLQSCLFHPSGTLAEKEFTEM